jgi:ABC-type antimicrobial peptide transport system permease subunit
VAIGARRGQVLRTILGRTCGCVSIGGIVGFVAGINASRLLENVVYQASARDPIVVLAAVSVLAAVAVVATFGPARRALAIEPSVALREG